MEFASLAFPSHPFVFACIEDPAPMQQVETAAGGARPVAAIQAFDRLSGNGE
jgi:hypothetical protein